MLEESFECLNQEQCSAYLNRLSMKMPDTCSPAFLDCLIRRHLETVPFENVNLALGHKMVRTELSHVYEKVVEKGQGGYCFELNALFLGLLRGLGYDAYPAACRVLTRPGLRMPTHRAGIVRIDGEKYFCDVGFGGIACMKAARMRCGEMTETDFGSFRFEPEYEGWLNFCHIPDPARPEEAVPILMVSVLPSAPVDFAAANQAMCRPDSIFYQRLTVQKMTPYGPVSVVGDTFTRRDAHGKESRKITSQKELLSILSDVFGLSPEL